LRPPARAPPFPYTTLFRSKRFLEDHVERTPKSVFHHDRSGTKHLEGILGDRRFPFPKDLAVMMHWIDMVAPADAAILDPFLGSRSEEHTSELQSRFDLVCR